MKTHPWIMICLVMALCAGCTTLPTQGSVHFEPRRSTDIGSGGITIVPESPPQGASPTMIIRGFLTAMASFGSDYATAREYLTHEASASWDPSQSDVLIYASGTTPRISGNQVSMSGPVIGMLHRDGSFAGTQEPTWNHDFALVREDGEWRISHPPDGLALSHYMFTQSYTRIDTYFLSSPGSVLVPDPRYVPRGAWDRTAATRLVINGPSSWLSTIIDPSPRHQVFLDGEVTLNKGIADIPLSPEAQLLDIDQATALAIEISASMGDVPGVSRVRLLSEGEVIDVAHSGADGSIAVSVAQDYRPPTMASQQVLYVESEGSVATLADSQLSVLPGDWNGMPRSISSLAVSRSTSDIAWVGDSGLVTVSGGQEPQTRLRSDLLLRPHYDSQGHLWAVSLSKGRAQLHMIGTDAVVDVDSSVLKGMTISGFQVSPDGRRVVFMSGAASPGGKAQHVLGIALIAYEDDVPTALVSWKPIRLTWQGAPLSSIIDVAWMGPSSLLVLGSDSGNPPGLFHTDIDGVGIEEWGYPQPWIPQEMAAVYTDSGPQIMILDTDHHVWAYQDGYRWSHPVDNVLQCLAFPS
jgi:hypothetical protein